MNNGKWKQEEECFVRENAGKKTLEEMAKHIGKSPLAVQLFMHRKKIVVGQTVKRNLVQEMLRIKFRQHGNFIVKSKLTKCGFGIFITAASRLRNQNTLRFLNTLD